MNTFKLRMKIKKNEFTQVSKMNNQFPQAKCSI